MVKGEVLQRVERLPGDLVIGREAELAVLDELLDSGPTQRALVLIGEAGIGKTTIVRAGLSRAASAGLRVFVARPTAGEMELPYVGLGDLLATVRTDALDMLAAPQRAAIEAALGRAGSSEAVDRHALSRGLLELLRLEAEGDLLLLAVDDMQWLDRPTAAALSFALRRMAPTPMRVLVAVRAEKGSSAELPLGLAEWESVRRLDVGPLSATELGAVLRQHLGAQLPRPRLEALRRDSAGNPMFALELARAPGGRAGSGPSGFSSVIGERLQTVDADARAALSFAAAALRPSTDLLLRAGVERVELRSALEIGILEADGERLSFAHPLLGTAAYELLLPEERREIHARLAAASTNLVERGHHLSRSVVDRDEAAAAELGRAAEEAANLGDHAGAAGFLLRAAELSVDPEGEAAQWRKLRAAAELDLAGDVEAAAALACTLLDRLHSGVARAQARRLLVFCSVGPGLSLKEALAELALALEDAGDDETVQAELHVLMAEICVGVFRFADAVAHGRTAIELAERTEASATVVAGLSELGFAECMLGGGVTEASRTAFARWDWSYLSPTNSPCLNLAVALVITTAFEQAEQLLRQELAVAEERGLEPIEAMAHGVTAEAELRAGRWAEALKNARLAFEHARQASVGQNVTGASYALAMTEALLGRHEEARALATEAMAEADATEDFWHRLSHRAVLGLIALAEDSPQGAVDVLVPAWKLMLESELGDLSILPVAQVVGEALVAVGRLDDASAVAQALRACPVGKQPWCRAMASRLEALVASARGDHDTARNSIAAALDAHAKLPEPFEHGRTLQVSGRVERTARNWGTARAVLVEALERFDALGAAVWAERTAADLARLPGRRPADGQELTVREREIAELVASGLANKEVAARLFVSVHTVEKNLSRAYAKLGVRSRTELASRLMRHADA